MDSAPRASAGRVRRKPVAGCRLLHTNAYAPVTCWPALAPAASGGPPAEMQVQALSPGDPSGLGQLLTCLLHPLIIMTFILLCRPIL